MKIVVCIKQVPATNEVRMDPVTNTIIREGIESVVNPFDAFAIEEALRLKERCGWEAVALSMGILSVETILREGLALGLDGAYLLSDRSFAGADTVATAYTLGLGIEHIKDAGLILCGKMASDGDTAQVGPMLAETLDIPHITDVCEIEEATEEYLLCRKLTDDGYIRVKVQLPAVVTVTKEINIPRLPSVRGILDSVNATVSILNAGSLQPEEERIGLKGSPTQVVRTFIPDLHIENQWLEGDTRQQAGALLEALADKQIIGRRRS